MSEKRPKRKVRVKSEVPIKVPRKWKDNEMEILLSCILKYGHKNLEKIQENLPGRSIENIKTFMRTVFDTACKMTKHDEVLDYWIKYCEALPGSPWNDCLQIAQVLKYLSVDGLLENHPLPECCQGIDFGQAYRLVYQAMMGYPLQSVNKPTAAFVVEAFAELSGEVMKQTDVIAKVNSFLQGKSMQKSNPVSNNSKISNNETSDSIKPKKPLKVYQRKKSVVPITETPPLRIVVEETPNSTNSGLGCSKDFSVTIEGINSNESTTVNVPVASEVPVDADEEELLKSSSYNPFQLPKKWLEEPLYLNLLQSL